MAHSSRMPNEGCDQLDDKSVLYSVARIIDARKFVCLDADMLLVLGGLAPLFAALEVAPPDSILACREANGHGLRDLNHTIHAVYGGRPSDLHRIMNGANREGNFDLPVNDGLFAGSRGAPSAGWPAPTMAVSHCLGG